MAGGSGRSLLGCCFFPGDVFAPVCGSFLVAEQERQVSFQGSTGLSLALISIRVAPSLTFFLSLGNSFVVAEEKQVPAKRNETKVCVLVRGKRQVVTLVSDIGCSEKKDIRSDVEYSKRAGTIIAEQRYSKEQVSKVSVLHEVSWKEPRRG